MWVGTGTFFFPVLSDPITFDVSFGACKVCSVICVCADLFHYTNVQWLGKSKSCVRMAIRINGYLSNNNRSSSCENDICVYMAYACGKWVHFIRLRRIVVACALDRSTQTHICICTYDIHKVNLGCLLSKRVSICDGRLRGSCELWLEGNSGRELEWLIK